MQKVILKYGCIYGLLLLTGFFLSYLILGSSTDNYSKSEIIGYSVMILSSITIYFATKQAKETTKGIRFSFFKGFQVGLGVSAIASTFFAVYNWLFVNLIEPDFMQAYMSYSKKQIVESGASQEVIDKQLLELSNYAELMNNEALYLLLMFMTIFVIGALFSLVISAALKD